MNRVSGLSSRTIVKWTSIIVVLFAYLITSAMMSVIPLPGRLRRAMRIRNTSFFSALALTVFGVRVTVKNGALLRSSPAGRLLICNHVSYVDVLAVSSLEPSVFITSVELRSTPLLGMLSRFGGSLFVERRSPSGLKNEIADISRILRQGFTVVLFPEGTTSNGEAVRDFKNSLFAAGVLAEVDVLPLCLRYTGINGEAVSPRNRDRLFYYGGVRFSKHFPEFMALASVELEAIALETIKADRNSSRKKIAAYAHAAICAAYGVE